MGSSPYVVPVSLCPCALEPTWIDQLAQAEIEILRDVKSVRRISMKAYRKLPTVSATQAVTQ